jgi:hypothetical protein
VSDRVFVRHPDHPERNGYVRPEAFEALWKRKGYEVVEPAPSRDAEPAADDAPALEREAAELNATLDRKEQLRGLLDAKGIEWDGRWGVKRLEAEYAKVSGT